MRRHPAWRSRLFNTVHAAIRQPFKWGENDCALFAARCIEAVTGQDAGAAQYLGAYDSRDGAYALLASLGHADLASLIIATLGAASEIHPSRARRGDIALLQTAEGEAIGVFDTERIGAIGLTGYATLERELAVRAFKVGL